MKVLKWSCKTLGIAFIALLMMSAGMVFNATPAKADSGLILPDGATMKIYGYTKLDMLWTDQAGGGTFAYTPGDVLLDNTVGANTSKFIMHARQSRLGFATSTPTELGKLKTKIETDFYGAGGNTHVSNSWGLRMRQAYGQLGNLLFGQTWSTFIDLNTYGDILDFGGPAGSLFIRQAMVRWTQPFNGGSFQFALENPHSSFISKAGATPTTGNSEIVPDIIARVNFANDFGKYSIATMARNLKVDQTIGGVHFDDNVWGYAVSLNAAIPTYNKDTIILQFNFGDALGRYMESEFADAFINPTNGDIETCNQMGIVAGYRHFWASNLRSSVLVSYAYRDNDLNYVANTVTKDYKSVHANIIWSPVKRVNIGAEYIYGYKELENSADGSMNRLECSFQFIF